MLEYYDIGEEVGVVEKPGQTFLIVACEAYTFKGEEWEICYTLCDKKNKEDILYGVCQKLLTKVYKPSKVSFQDLLKL